MQQLTLVQKLAVAVIPVLFAITLHEVAHGWIARRFGDRTAEMLGRLTINPLKHIDPLGTIVVPALSLMLGNFLFGWAKPVPVSVRNLRHPRRDMIFVAVAGPVANLLMAIFWAFLARAVMGLGLQGGAAVFLLGMAQVGVLINVILAVFNMFPLPPLDGGRVVAGLLPPASAARFESLERYGLLIIIALLFTGILWKVLGPVMSFVSDLVLTIAGF